MLHNWVKKIMIEINRFFGFKGDLTGQSSPSIVYFKYSTLTIVKVKMNTLESAGCHYGGANVTPIIPLSGSEEDAEVTRAVFIHVKWAAYLIYK